MYNEAQFLRLLQIGSNIGPAEFEGIFGDEGRSLFQLFARDGHNMISFMFNKINGDNREKFINYINKNL